MTSFFLKLIAMTTMVIDHVGHRFVTNNTTMRCIGRMAFLLYAFLIAESYYHLRDKPDRLKSHVIKLLVLCVVTEPFFDMFTRSSWFSLSAQSSLFTLLLGFLALIASGRWSRKFHRTRAFAIGGSAVLCLAAALISYGIKSEYKLTGVLLIVVLYLYLQIADSLSLPKRFAVLTVLFAGYFVLYMWSRSGYRDWAALLSTMRAYRTRVPGMLAPIVPIALYNRRLGYRSRWFSTLYSWFYPLQFIALLILLEVIPH